MDSETNHHLQKLLTTFNAVELGDGNPVTGANTLAAMCGVLANVSRPGSGVRTEQGGHHRIGTSLLVSGSASSGRVVDEVLLELGRRQNNFSRHLQRELEWRKEMSQKPGMTAPPDRPRANGAENVFTALLGGEENLFGTNADAWMRVLTEAPTESFADLATGPKFFVAAARPDDLDRQLVGLRRGQPLVHLSVTRQSDMAGFGTSVGALLDGCHAVGNRGETVHGHVLVTDPHKMLNAAIRNPDDGLEWLERFVWLCDHDVGPEAPVEPGSGKMATADSLAARFQEALGRGLANRLDGKQNDPQIVKADITKAQHRWTAFLNETESSVPGISGAARNLLSTLDFGLVQLSRVANGKQLRFNLKEAEAFATFLVHRMANAHTSILHASRLARRQSDIRRVFNKLGSLPIDERTIYKCLKLEAATCRECLRWLEDSGLSRRVEDGWLRVEEAQLTFTGQPLLALAI